MDMCEYKPGDLVPVTSPLYRVIHHPRKKTEQMETFFKGDHFPPCPECGEKVRYMLANHLLHLHSK
jgi:hypothetical protein